LKIFFDLEKEETKLWHEDATYIYERLNAENNRLKRLPKEYYLSINANHQINFLEAGVLFNILYATI
jgi:hypothetical protein